VNLAGCTRARQLAATSIVCCSTLLGQEAVAQSSSPSPRCAELLGMRIENITISSTTEVPDGSRLQVDFVPGLSTRGMTIFGFRAVGDSTGFFWQSAE
jgi:hypothetical protein